MKDLTISLANAPGALAAVGEATGRAGVNIEGVCAYVEAGHAVAHICVDDASRLRTALEEAGLEVLAEQDVVVVALQDRPGVLGGVARRVSDAGVNLSLAYLATGTRIVLAADDLEKVEAAV